VQGWLGFFMLPPRNKTNSPGAAQRGGADGPQAQEKGGVVPHVLREINAPKSFPRYRRHGAMQ
jgi:hypothetical protein